MRLRFLRRGEALELLRRRLGACGGELTTVEEGAVLDACREGVDFGDSPCYPAARVVQAMVEAGTRAAKRVIAAREGGREGQMRLLAQDFGL